MSHDLEKGGLTLYQTIPIFHDPLKKDLENTVGKGENAGNQHFLLFPQCFLLYQREKLSFYQHLICRLQVLSIWSRPNFCCFGKELMHLRFV